MGLFKPAWQSDNKEKALRAFNKLSEKKALMALNILTDQSILIDIVKSGITNYYVRMEAVKKLTDQALLADVVKYVSDSNLKGVKYDLLKEAIEKLIDQALLADVAKINDLGFHKKGFEQIGGFRVQTINEEWYVSEEAVKKLTDQALLVDVAKNAKHMNVRKMAAEKL